MAKRKSNRIERGFHSVGVSSDDMRKVMSPRSWVAYTSLEFANRPISEATDLELFTANQQWCLNEAMRQGLVLG